MIIMKYEAKTDTKVGPDRSAPYVSYRLQL
jgi:hypothetical protein